MVKEDCLGGEGGSLSYMVKEDHLVGEEGSLVRDDGGEILQVRLVRYDF